MWRKRGEAALPVFSLGAGHLGYVKQVPLSLEVPMWGGLSYGGFAPVRFHPQKQLVNYSTANLPWLESHDWVGNPENLKFALMKSEENKCEKAKNVVYNEVLL